MGAHMQPTPPLNGVSLEAQPRSPHSFALSNQGTPTASRQHPGGNGGQPTRELASPGKPPLEHAANPARVLALETVSARPVIAAERQDRPSAPPQPSPITDPAHKRKAKSEENDQSLAATPNRVKRPKLEKKADGADSPAIAQSSPAVGLRTPNRTVSFEEVYGAPGKPVQHKHIIVQFPLATGEFYILRCDEHGVHFGEHPLRGAAKHLASAQHGFMSKAHATAIETLGHRVLGCTKELADMNNHDVLRAFKNGYKAFNANNLSQTKRAELGYPPLDPLNSQKVAMHRKQTGRITDPVPCRFYVGGGGELKCPVLILPWADTSPAGLIGTLADTGLLSEPVEGENPMGVPTLPKCYVYHKVDGRITGIRGWAKGYEKGGPLEAKREFPVLCAESTD